VEQLAVWVISTLIAVAVCTLVMEPLLLLLLCIIVFVFRARTHGVLAAVTRHARVHAALLWRSAWLPRPVPK
jgi:hypothetical protein